MDWGPLLVEILETLPSRMTAQRLSYLTATSKVEGPVRDELAYALHERLSPDGLRVAREWTAGRRDLAVLDADGHAVMELEAKALYGLDTVSPPQQHRFLHSDEGHARDVRKMRAAIERGTSCFLLSLVTHPLDRVPPPLHSVIKYSPRHNTAVSRMGTAEGLRSTARSWRDQLDVWGAPVATREWALGDVYAVPFALDCHLVGPLTDDSVRAAARSQR